MAAPLLFLLLFLPVSSAAIGPAPKTGVTKELRTTVNKSVKLYMEQRAGRPGQRKDGEQQTGSAAGDSYAYRPFIFDLSVGTSPQTLPVIMDITTDLVWAQCDTTLSSPSTPSFQPGQSKSFAEVGCATQTCQRMSGHDCAGNDVCRYTTDSMSGFLATDTFSFGNITGPGRTDVPGVVFGCRSNTTVHDEDDDGISRAPLSLVSQLNISSFTYFIAPTDDAAGKSFVSWSWGGAADNNDDAVLQTTTTGGSGSSSSSTPLVVATKTQNPYWYYVNLTGVQLDGTLLTAIPAGTFDVSDGVVLSTMYPGTLLVEPAYSVLREELVSRLQSDGAAPVNASNDGHLCFLTEQFANAKVPTLALLFDGAEAAMELKVENYFVDMGDGYTCLTIQPSPWGLRGSVLGSLLQAGRKMTYEIHSDGGGVLTFETFETAAAGAPAPAKAPLMIMAALLLGALL